jgi:hypothetical protein
MFIITSATVAHSDDLATAGKLGKEMNKAGRADTYFLKGKGRSNSVKEGHERYGLAVATFVQ